MTDFKTALLFTALTAIASASAIAQDYYDDDIYYNPSKKAKKETVTKIKGYATPVADYPAADTYTVITSSAPTMSVDEYNRRGIFADSKTAATDTSVTDFNYTRRIERFYNPDVVTSTGDSQLADIYYAEPANVNIIINNPYPTYWGWSSPSWAWGYPYNSWGWNSWNYWGPTWSWSWGWNSPSWAWGWSPSWAWGTGWYPGWGPSWNPGWGPAWSVPARPGRHPGQSWTPGRRPATDNGNVRPGTVYRPGSVANVGNVSTGNGRRPATGVSTATRPSSSTTVTRPSTGTSLSGRRPGTTADQSGNSFTRPSNTNNSYNNNNNSYNNNNNSYTRPGRSGSSSYSSGGYSGGSSRGGSYSGGGGSSRGGRAGGRH